MRADVIIVGGGVSGLATAHALRARGLTTLVLEAAARPGGNIRSEHDGGFTVEWGPNGFLDNVPETLELVRTLGLTDRLQRSSDAARRRFLWRRGRLLPLPEGPVSFLRSPILSLRGRLRVLAEPFARAPEAAGDDETVHAFAARRIGREAADVLVDAMVSGVFAGDARRLSLRATFPKMHAMEREHGSLMKAMRARARARRQARRRGEEAPAAGPAGPGGTLTSFVGGFEDLIRGLVDALPAGAMQTGTRVSALGRVPGAWRVEAGGAFEAPHVVLACPAWHAAALLCDVDPPLAALLDGIGSAPLAVVALAWPTADLPAPLDAFGYLVPRTEGMRSLGALFDSSVFPGRAPDGMTLVRVMIGGAHDPEALDLDDQSLVHLARTDLEATLGIRPPPARSWVFRHARGIPQYAPGHAATLEAADRRLARLAGLHLTGNAYRGVSVNQCVVDAGRVAGRIADEAKSGT